MMLTVIVDDKQLELNLPDDFLSEAEGFFARMDADMDRGWQVNREWVEQPDRLLRAQIAADKLLTALENENDRLGRMMAGYIVTRVPGIERLELNPAGEIRDHRVVTGSASASAADTTVTIAHPGIPSGLDKMSAMAQAGKDVSKVFKMGRHYRFSVYNHASGQWEESPAIGDREQAEAMREQAFKSRFEALCQSPTRH